MVQCSNILAWFRRHGTSHHLELQNPTLLLSINSIIELNEDNYYDVITFFSSSESRFSLKDMVQYHVLNNIQCTFVVCSACSMDAMADTENCNSYSINLEHNYIIIQFITCLAKLTLVSTLVLKSIVIFIAVTV